LEDGAGSKSFQTAEGRLKVMMRQGIPLSGNERNVCFLNLGRTAAAKSAAGVSRFATASGISGMDFADDARGLATVDWDFDGDLDLWLTNRTGPQVRFLRNDLAPGRHHFLAIKLQGVKCNRDAIGARVEVLLPDGEKLIETLRAGEGFLSQSSKWLHFGLGEARTVQRVTIRWPGSSTQQFTDVAVDRFYRLRQDDAELKAHQPPRNRPQLAMSSAGKPSKTSAVAVFLPDRLTSLRLPYKTFRQHERDVELTGDRPLLLILWTDRCKTCVRELTQLAKEKPALDAMGVRVLALSINGVGAAPTSSRQSEVFLKKIAFPFPSGQATPELIDKLQLLHRELLYRPYTLPVPVSFLISRDGELAAIYRGAIQTDRLAEHVQRLATETAVGKTDSSSGHFPGRWIKPPMYVNRELLLMRLFIENWIEDAEDFFESNRTHFPEENLTTILNRLASGFLKARNHEKAKFYLDQVVARDPSHAKAWNNLGVIAYVRRNSVLAQRHYLKAIEADSQYWEPLDNLGTLLLKSRRAAAAIEPLSKAVKLKPKDVNIRFKLAAAYAESGHWDKARARYEQVLEHETDHRGALIALAKVCFKQGEMPRADAYLTRALAHKEITLREQRTLTRLKELIDKRLQPR
jgi:Tfp pilus assembly protein PilF/peroxiredoxin